ncbi:MAG: UDP-N-acetylglucosamine 4,6-dehydratase (inverting) [Rhizobiales bacterium]|nr:UDP-N-acetylglucosamine 4,6-dehydratase (inverting) [Hyphomicrobiales bacterium]
MLDDKAILITGGTGSFGKKFIKTVLKRHDPRRVIVFSRDELKQHEMSLTIDNHRMRYFIGDVRDAARITMAMQDVDIVIHAAALKQVPALEYNPTEAIRTNIYGTENVLTAALANDVEQVVVLSTDKAAAPINLYGATKLAADKLTVAANNIRGSSKSRFSVVRYGNVIGSRGSVIPLFQKMVADGATELPITDLAMTRFLISLQDGVDFVLKTLERMQGGELFIPKIPSATIGTIAKAVSSDVKLNEIGIRPGEKLHEVMCPSDLASLTHEYDEFFLIEPSFKFFHDTNYTQTRLGEKGRPVAPDFEYNSNTNPDFVDEDALREIIANAMPFDD